MDETVIQVKNLSKRYRIGLRKDPRRKDVLRIGANFVRHLRQMLAKPTPDEIIWALKDISFEVKRGEIVGVIGPNGAGKSTLLKILSRITEPTEGYAELHGKVGTLLEVGTGFHPELTGRENVYLSGAINGMKKAEIDRKFDEIVSFAEIERFIDTPVKRYSSGMYVRLAFAVAAHLEPDILLVDEVLAVGDAAFQKKCIGKMGSVAKEGRTILFVSHNMGTISRLCQRAIWLNEGKLRMEGSAGQVVSSYLTSQTSLVGEKSWKYGYANRDVNDFKILSVRIKNSEGIVASSLDVKEPFFVEIEYKVIKKLWNCRIGFLLRKLDGTAVFETYDSDFLYSGQHRSPGAYRSICKIPGLLLNPGRFVLSVNAAIKGREYLANLPNVLLIDVEDTGAAGPYGGIRQGVIRPQLQWNIVSVS